MMVEKRACKRHACSSDSNYTGVGRADTETGAAILYAYLTSSPGGFADGRMMF
jgi:hypothetical protein